MLALRTLFLLCLVSLLFVVACGKSAGQKILADEAFFPKGLADFAEKNRAGCPDQLQRAREIAHASSGAIVKTASLSYTAQLPAEYRPALSDIERKYGLPNRAKESVWYYGDIGLKEENGKVVAVIFTCDKN